MRLGGSIMGDYIDENGRVYEYKHSYEAMKRMRDNQAIEQLFLDCGYSGEEGREIL